MPTRLLWNNWFDDADLTASSAAFRGAAANLQDDLLSRIWQTGVSSAAETLVMDLGEAKTPTVFAAVAHTLTSGDSLIKLQGNASDSWGSPTVNETITFSADKLVHYIASPQALRYWRFIFTKSSSAARRRFGRLFLGPYFEPSRAADQGGFIVEPVDLSVTSRSIGGPTWTDIRPKIEQVRVEFSTAEQDTYDEFKSMVDAMGSGIPVWLAADPTNYPTEWLWFGKLTNLRERVHRYYNGSGTDHLWDLALELTEEPF